MPRFEPFAALRYSPDQSLELVAAPPYDVISDRDVKDLLARDPHNIVAVDVPKESDGDDRYALAAKLLQDWIDDGILVTDDTPSFTLYRMQFADESGRSRETVGVIGALEVVDEGADGVLPTNARPRRPRPTGSISRSPPGPTCRRCGVSRWPRVSPICSSNPASHWARVTTKNGVVHTVERITAPERITAISAAVGAAPVVIADGHHRYAVSRTYRDQRREATGRTDLGSELTLAYVGELVEDQLSVAAIHRLLTGVSDQVLLASLAPMFEMSPAGSVEPGHALDVVDRGALCLVHKDGQGTFMTPRPECFAGVRDLDSARLEHALEHAPALAGKCDVSYQHGVGNIVAAVTGGDVDAGVLLRPVSIAEIRRTADEGVLMPPKSTFFSPKLRTGLVIRPFGD